MVVKGRRSSNKSPPILSHEFVIQNHADIVSCVAMLFVVGLMIQATSSIAYLFIAVHHNVTALIEAGTPLAERPDPPLFSYGWKDFCAVFFYFLICIVMHAIIQEYILDKVSRKLHLSKVKLSKFNESGQLLAFYVISVLWGADIIFRENLLLNMTMLWEGYPHSAMVFMNKFFFIIQLSYWLHCYPELYFQKTKRDEIPERVKYATLGFFAAAALYLLNFNRVGICLLVLHYASEAVFHVARIVDYVDKEENGNKVGYVVANAVFVFVRLASIILSVLTFWYGLALSENQGFDFAAGNFNTPIIRLTSLISVCVLQAYFMWHFITDQLKQMREQAAANQSAKNRAKKERQAKKIKKDDDVNDLPEVDQNTKKTLRMRPAAKSK